MSDYATVVDARTLPARPLAARAALKPYWVTPSADGRSCYISWSGSDRISKISYAHRADHADACAVGDHPQRVRNGYVARRWSPASPRVDVPSR